jgi:hypothetical protein
MHNIKPNTKHTIMTVTVAVRTDDEDTAYDALDEALRPLLTDDDSLVADYALAAGPVVESPAEPVEGEWWS